MIQRKKVLNFAFYSLLGVLSLLLSSCSIYKQQFDCPPPAGIPCASVTEIESMVVETDKGCDLIVKPEVEENNHCFWCGAQKPSQAFPSKTSKSNTKVWICSQKRVDGVRGGHYFQKSDTPENIALEPEDIFNCQRKEN